MAEPLIEEPTGIADWTRNVALSIVRGGWTLCPAIVTKVNSNMTVNVRLKVEDNLSMVELQGLPIVFLRGGSSAILTPIGVDDVVLVGFSKYKLEGLLTNTQIVKKDLEAEDFFGVENAIVLGGFILDSEKAIFQLPTEGISIGELVQLRDLGGDPSSPQNGMLWRNGDKIFAHSNDVTFELGAGGSTSDMGKVLDKVNSTLAYASGETDVYQYVAGSNVLRRLVGEVKVVGIFTVGRVITVRAWSKIDDTNWSLKDITSFTLAADSQNPCVDTTSQKTMKITLEVYPAESKTVNYSAEVTQMEQ